MPVHARARRSVCTPAQFILLEDSSTCTSIVECPSNTRIVGDVNGDCVFNVNDAAFALAYVLEDTIGFESARGQRFLSYIRQFPEVADVVDFDFDGVVSVTDAFYANLANLNVVRLLSNIAIDATCARDCIVTMSVDARTRTGDAAGADTLVFADIGVVADGAISSLRAAEGVVVTTNKGSGLFGAVVQLARNGSVHSAQVAVDVAQDVIAGVSFLQVTPDLVARPALRPCLA